MKIKLITTLICATFFLTVFSPTVMAKVGLALDPAIVRIQIKPGKSITKAFTVYNTETENKDLVLRLVPFSKSDEYGNPVINIEEVAEWSKYFSLSNTNIKLNEPFVVKAKSQEQIILSISIPENSDLKDIYLTLLFSTYDNSTTADQEGTQISASIGANMLISITSELNPKTILKVDNINITSGSYFKLGRRYFVDNLTPIRFKASVTNTGNHLTETKGLIRISKKNGEVVSVEETIPQYVISKNTRQLLSKNNQDFSFNPGLRNMGPYLLSFEIKSDNSNTKNSIEIFFFPFKGFLGLVVLFIVLKIILGFRSKRIDN